MEIINAKLLKNQQDLEQLNWFESAGQGVISRYYFIFFPLLLKVFLKTHFEFQWGYLFPCGFKQSSFVGLTLKPGKTKARSETLRSLNKGLGFN